MTKAWVCSCNGWLDGVVLPPKTDCPDCHGTGRRETPVALEEWLPLGHPENPEHPQNRIGRLIDSLYAIRDSILNLDLKDALAGIDHALRMEAVEPAPDHHYQTPEGWQ